MAFREKILILLLLMLCFLTFIGCNSQKRGDVAQTPNAPFAAVSTGNKDNGSTGGEDNVPLGKLAKEIKQLEAEGKYPVLDRSDTLLGKDENNNGVRDDIENYISSLQDRTKEQKSAFMQMAYVFNYVLSPEYDPKNKEHITREMDMYGEALECISEHNNGSLGKKDYQLIDLLYAFTYNTKKRLLISFESERTAGGMTFSLSGEIEGSCDEKFFKD